MRSGHLILENINFSLPPGSCLILRGANGSGKTTLLKTLAGILPYYSGSLSLDQEQVVYMGHLDAIKAQLSVYENLRFWAGVYHSENLDQVSDDLDLFPLHDRFCQTLSAGQKRRLSLARLLLSQCKIWLLDEPTNSLDHKNSTIFILLIKKHCRTGGIAIISSHIDLNIPKTRTLELSQFIPKDPTSNDPFLAGSFK